MSAQWLLIFFSFCKHVFRLFLSIRDEFTIITRVLTAVNQKWTISVCSRFCLFSICSSFAVLVSFLFCCLFLLSSASSKPLVLLVLIISSSIHSPSLQNQHSHTLSVTHTHSRFPANSAAHVQNHFIFQLNLSMQNKLCVCVYKSASSSESEHSPKAETTPSITIPISSDLCHSLSLNRPANDCTFSSNIHPHLSSNTLQNFIVQIVLASIWERNYIYI